MAGSVYVVSDLHGDYEGFMQVLRKINFTENDVMYINGDIIDGGEDGIKLLQFLMMKVNIYPIIGDHEFLAIKCLDFLSQDMESVSVKNIDPECMKALMEWQKMGGQATIDAFKALSEEEKESIMDYLGEFSLYEETEVNGKEYVIVHAGIDSFDPDKDMEDYSPEELIYKSPDYDKVYFEDKYLITGHKNVAEIHGAKADEVYMKNNHIAIDCGAGFGGRVACLCLNTMKVVYGD